MFGKKAFLQFGVLLVGFTTGFAQEAPRAAMPESHFEIFDKYCLDCHDSLSEKGGVNLEDLSFDLNSIQSAELWQKVLNSMNSGEMPPEDKDQLTADEKTVFLDDLSHQLVIARDVLSDSGGVITMRRLNRREYENTIEDLLGVKIDASDLPDDHVSEGFDTTGAALFFSSDQFEQYLTLADRALDELLTFEPERPKLRKQKFQPENSLNKFYTKISGKLKADWDLAVEWRETEGKRAPKAFGFIDEDDVKFHERLYNQQYETYRQYLDRPETEDGVLLAKFFNGAVVGRYDISPKWPNGTYKLRARVAALGGAPSNERFLDYGLTGGGARQGELEVLGCLEVTGTMENPQVVEIPITLDSSTRRSYGLRQRQHNNRDAARGTFLQSQVKTGVGPDPSIWLDWIEVEGPMIEEWPPRNLTNIFFKGVDLKQIEDRDAYASEIIERFAKRAFRIKTPSPSYLEKLHEIYLAEIRDGANFFTAIREPLSTVLASPGFLYLLEPAAGQEKRELNDLEFAVRLAYFLWSAPPDEALYAAARNGTLKKPKTLAAQANRMLNDPRADEFIKSFAHQWLHMERLDFFQFDFRLYPLFDDSVKEAAREEVFASIRSVIQESRPIGDLLKSDYVVVNNLLADYYGLEGVEGEAFQKVSLPADSARGGLLGMAAIHAMGSDGTRSSPVERGTWVMKKLLDDPPPPAPANVPQLSRIGNKLLSPRELQNAHMEEPQCAQCHRKIDPIGYGMQNFDAAGLWRETLKLTAPRKNKKQQPETKVIDIDPTGQLPDGSKFEDFFGLRDQVAQKESAFARGFTEALIEYALGRPYGFSDEQLRENLLKRAKANDLEMREIILALIQSKPFRTKK